LIEYTETIVRDLLDEDGWDYYFINAPCYDFIAQREKLKMLIEVKGINYPYILVRQLCGLIVAAEILNTYAVIIVVGNRKALFYDTYELASYYELECDGEDSFFDDTELSIEAIYPYYEKAY
jgi:hypothetical protein